MTSSGKGPLFLGRHHKLWACLELGTDGAAVLRPVVSSDIVIELRPRVFETGRQLRRPRRHQPGCHGSNAAFGSTDMEASSGTTDDGKGSRAGLDDRFPRQPRSSERQAAPSRNPRRVRLPGAVEHRSRTRGGQLAEVRMVRTGAGRGGRTIVEYLQTRRCSSGGNVGPRLQSRFLRCANDPVMSNGGRIAVRGRHPVVQFLAVVDARPGCTRRPWHHDGRRARPMRSTRGSRSGFSHSARCGRWGLWAAECPPPSSYAARANRHTASSPPRWWEI